MLFDKTIKAVREAWDTLHGRPVMAYPFEMPCPCHEVSDAAQLPAEPEVSVVVAVWNHAAYLADAIAGLVSQRADFPYEILLCEDCSSDDSREICLAAQRRYPSLIRVLFGERNLGGRLNFLHGIELARGRYVALLEGDDFWSNPEKLSLQIEALRRGGGARMCVAWNERLEEKTGARRKITFPQTTELRRESYRGGYYHTSTYVFEKSLWEEVLPYFTYIPFYDTTFTILVLALAGRIAIVPEYVSVYRQSGKGGYTGASGVVRAETGCLMFARLLKFGPPNMRALAGRACFDARANVFIASLAMGRWTWEASLALVLAVGQVVSAIRFRCSRFLMLRMAKSAVQFPYRYLRRIREEGRHD